MQRKKGYVRNGHTDYYIWGLFLLFLFFLAYKFPVVGDDWYALRVHITSLQELIENGARHWNNVNGRWLGHMAVILSMSSRILCAAVRAVIIWLIMILGYKNSGFKCKEGCLIVFLYILAVPKEIFSETYSWAAGFFNYVPPVLLVFLYLYLISTEFSRKQGGGEKEFSRQDYCCLCNRNMQSAVYRKCYNLCCDTGSCDQWILYKTI